MGHQLSAPSGDDWERVQPHHSAAPWNLSVILGRSAVFIVLAVIATYAFGEQDHVYAKLEPLLPRPLLRLWASAIGKSEAARGFTVGNTKEEVLRAQGKPSSVSGNVWSYGESKVFFHGDRVIDWKTTSANPLRTR